MEVIRYPREFLDEVKAKNDIVEVAREMGVKLHRMMGGRYSACCPFPNHKDDTPSFSVYEDKQNYTCYGCNSTGDIIDLVKNISEISFFEAIQRLIERAGIVVEDMDTFEKEVTLEWGQQNEEDTKVSPKDLALFYFAKARTTLQKIHQSCGGDSDEFETSFAEIESLYRKFDHASSEVIEESIANQVKALSSKLEENYLEDSNTARLSHGKWISSGSHHGQ
jgi:hypothetical protein